MTKGIDEEEDRFIRSVHIFTECSIFPDMPVAVQGTGNKIACNRLAGVWPLASPFTRYTTLSRLFNLSEHRLCILYNR